MNIPFMIDIPDDLSDKSSEVIAAQTSLKVHLSDVARKATEMFEEFNATLDPNQLLDQRIKHLIAHILGTDTLERLQFEITWTKHIKASYEHGHAELLKRKNSPPPPQIYLPDGQSHIVPPSNGGIPNE